MSAKTFQARLADFIANGGPPEDALLTSLERRRLASIAEQPGAEIMRTLYFSWRLTKVLSLLPYTSRLLGDTELARRLRRFWGRTPARSLYFVEECLKFIDFLECETDLPGSDALDDILGFERAKLELRDDDAHGRPVRARHVRFHYAPGDLFRALSSGTDIAGVERCDVVLRGELTPDGQEQWFVTDRGELQTDASTERAE